MKISKTNVSIALMGLFAANVALAVPGFSTEAPQASVDACIAAVKENVSFEEAGSVLYNVETEDRRVSGHKMSIQTLVYGDTDESLIREYKAVCAINDDAEIKMFNIRQKGN